LDFLTLKKGQEKEPIETTIDSKYVQQHLANERTFLAWIRTGIAIAGLGFLLSQFVFHSSSFYRIVANTIGMVSFFLGVFVLFFATRDYLKKREGINKETFNSPIFSVVFVSISLSLIIIVILILAGILFFT
jgi:putative membrane protein